VRPGPAARGAPTLLWMTGDGPSIAPVPVDPDLFDQVLAAEDALIDARHAVDTRRADLVRAVRRLQRHGASIAEVAEAVGWSRSRVERIVEEGVWRESLDVSRQHSDVVCCSFCTLTQKEVAKLIAGPAVYICDQCVGTASAHLTSAPISPAPSGDGGPGPRIEPVEQTARREACSFCAKTRGGVEGMAATGDVRICNECLALCHEIITEELGELAGP
jgi:hypothetical protein